MIFETVNRGSADVPVRIVQQPDVPVT